MSVPDRSISASEGPGGACHKKGLIILPTLGAGGAERVMLSLFDRIGDSGRNELLVITDASDRLSYLISPNWHVTRLGHKRVLHGFWGLLRALRGATCDFIITTHAHVSFFVLAMKYCFPSRVAVIVRESTVVSKNLPAARLRRTLWRIFYAALYRLADVVICQSNQSAEDIIGVIGLPRKLIKVIGNPIDCSRIRGLSRMAIATRRRPDEFVLVSAGRFSAEKGFDLLVRAIARTGDKSIRLWLIGEGPGLEETRQLARERGVESQIDFLGYRENPYPYFAAADWYVLSSLYEGFPNAVLEALCCGTPVVSTPCPGGIYDILIEGVNGIFATQGGDIALAEAIIRARNMGAMDRGKVHDSVAERYAIEFIAAKYRAVIENAVAAKQRG